MSIDLDLPRQIDLDDDFVEAVGEVGQRLPNPLPSKRNGMSNAISAGVAFNRTDIGNAKRLVKRHGQRIRFVHVWGKWLVYDGRHWKVDDTGEIFQLAKDTVASIYQETAEMFDAESRKLLAGHASRSEAEGKLKSMVFLATSEEGIPIRPAELDFDPLKFNVLNGTLDLLSGKLLPHNPADRITRLAPVIYDPEVKAPLWESFVFQIMAGNDNLVQFLQRYMGYAMTGNTTEQCLVLAYGTGSNGKSTFIEVIAAIFGDYGAVADFSTFATQSGERIRNDLARLHGPRLVRAIEAGDGVRFDEATIKQLTGGDVITARFLHAEYFEFKPQFKLFLAANHKPRIKGTDHAIWRRIRLVPFTVTIPDHEQDKELPDKLLAESSGILNWMIDGCLAWRCDGLGLPDEVREATEGYRNEEDPLSDFIDECCVTGSTMEASAGNLYQSYAEWAERNGERAMPQRTFGTRLHERGFDQHKGSKGKRFWIGIGLKHEE